MGKVAVTLKIMPADSDADLDSIKSRVKGVIERHKEASLKGLEERPIAFGLKALEILLVLPDGSISLLEEELAKVEGVASVEAGNVTLI